MTLDTYLNVLLAVFLTFLMVAAAVMIVVATCMAIKEWRRK